METKQFLEEKKTQKQNKNLIKLYYERDTVITFTACLLHKIIYKE